METTRTFPLNAWYVAAWSHEVGRRQPLGRTVCDTRMVFWRSADGAITALEDACWHRLLPLSIGWLEGDEVVCRYHGLAFDSKGQCTRMPSQDKLNGRSGANPRSGDRLPGTENPGPPICCWLPSRHACISVIFKQKSNGTTSRDL
jgi:phenylpropionate dioxygenase-like ring-hydroxylating dioxygenase large terminal subunit